MLPQGYAQQPAATYPQPSYVPQQSYVPQTAAATNPVAYPAAPQQALAAQNQAAAGAQNVLGGGGTTPDPSTVSPTDPSATSATSATPPAPSSVAPGAANVTGGGPTTPDMSGILAALQQAIASLTQLVAGLSQQASAANGGGGGVAGGGAGAASCCGAGTSAGGGSNASGGGAVPSASTSPSDTSNALPPIPSSNGPSPSDAALNAASDATSGGGSVLSPAPSSSSLPPIPASSGPMLAPAAAAASATNSDGSHNWEQEAKNAAIAAGLDPNIFARQIKQESGFNPNAGSPAGAQGIAQIMPGTAKSWGVDPHDPKAALKAAAEHMKQYVDKYGGDYRKALAAYNAGEGAVAKYNGVPPFPETQKYVQIIMGG
ncbi:MAG: lytic transglycosylase domain-containing protein [Gaiellales bacterium]